MAMKSKSKHKNQSTRINAAKGKAYKVTALQEVKEIIKTQTALAETVGAENERGNDYD